MTEKLDKGLLDWAVPVEEPDEEKYHVLHLPDGNRWGLVMPADCPLSHREHITADDWVGLPLFCSEQGWAYDMPKWCGPRMKELTIEGSFRLAYNGSVFVRERLGYLLTFEHLVDTSESSGLVFRPLDPPLVARLYIIRKKRQAFTPIVQRFIKHLKECFGDGQAMNQ